MMFLRYFTLAAALLMVIVQPVKSDNNELEAALREALLTDYNINILQSIFYPDDGSDFSEADITIDIVVNNINYPNRDGAFSCSIEGHYACHLKEQLHISAVGNLKSYLKRFMHFLQPADIAFYKLLTSVTGGFYLYNKFEMHLYIRNLTYNPISYDFQSAMEGLFKWAKYYAKLKVNRNMSLILESDRSVVTMEFYSKEASNGLDLIHMFLIIGIIISLQFLVMIFNIYSPKIASSEISITMQQKHSICCKLKYPLFWSACIVSYIINISCSIVEVNHMISFPDMLVIYFYYTFPMCIFLFIEIIVLLSCLRKRIELSSRICCITNKCFVRVIYSFAICNIFWLAHRVGRCFVVSIYFIAISPASTLSVIMFCVTTVIIFIATFTIILYTGCYTNSKCCAKVCKSLIILLIMLFLLSFIVCFTLIFVIFTLNGLSAASLGTIILSLTIPLFMFAVSFSIKNYLKKITTDDDSYSSINDEQDAREKQPILGESNV